MLNLLAAAAARSWSKGFVPVNILHKSLFQLPVRDINFLNVTFRLAVLSFHSFCDRESSHRVLSVLYSYRSTFCLAYYVESNNMCRSQAVLCMVLSHHRACIICYQMYRGLFKYWKCFKRLISHTRGRPVWAPREHCGTYTQSIFYPITHAGLVWP